MTIVDSVDLSQWLQITVTDSTAAVAIRVAEGWLRSVVRSLPEWPPPEPVPEDLWSWTLELAAIAYTNPQGQRSRTVGNDATEWGLDRRAEILAAAANRYGIASPVGSFPPPGPSW